MYADNVPVSTPVIVEHPGTVTVDLFEEVVLACRAEGNPQPMLQWYKDGQILSGVSSQSLSISRVEVPDRGAYYCIASNSEGSVQSTTASISIRSMLYHCFMPSFIIIPRPDRYPSVLWFSVRPW